MKNGRSLTELAMELQRQQQQKRDFVVATSNMRMSEDNQGFHIQSGEEAGIVDGVGLGFSMTDLFHRQIGASLGIPAKYYDKMRESYPAMLAYNVNGWFRREPSKHTIRTLDGLARAFLSDRYRRIDNYEIAQATLPVIGEMADARVESCEVTPNRMYIKVVNPRLESEVLPGDIVQAGIVISNSEVGLGSVSVMPLAYRLVCANGMIVNDYGQRKYHIGRELEESWEMCSDATMQAEDTAFLMKLADIVRTAVDEARFGKIVGKLREAAGMPITAPVANVVELTCRQYGFTGNEENEILQHLIEGGDLSLYGLSNAVTRASRDVYDYDRATALESAGWQIATMPRDIWRDINSEG